MILFVNLVYCHTHRAMLQLVDSPHGLFLGSIQEVHHLVIDSVAGRLPKGRLPLQNGTSVFRRIERHLPSLELSLEYDYHFTKD